MIGRTLNLGNPVNRNHPLNRGLVSRWLTLQGGGYYGGTRMLDLMGANHGTLTNGPTWQSAQGRPGGSGSLNFVQASGHYVDLGSCAHSGTEWSGGIWFKTSQNHTPTTINLFGRAELGSYDWMIYLQSNAINLFWHDGASADNIQWNVTYSDNVWRHVFVTFNAGVATMYGDGVSVATKSSAVVSVRSVQTVKIGRGWDATYQGDADGATIFNRAPSAPEVLALYNDSRLGSPDTLHWIRRPWLAQTAAAGNKLLLRMMSEGLYAGSGGNAV